MPIDAPNLDDLTYAEIVERAKQLIPVYCPEWTNFNDADPGMTLVQLFAWMTEMTIYRLNRVPDATYVHFLNFIGERRGAALPARTLVSFRKINDKTGPVTVPKLTEVATVQTEDVDEVRFLTSRDLTVLGPRMERILGLNVTGERDIDRVRLAAERIMNPDPELPPVYELGEAAGQDAGLPLLELDEVRDNLNANIYDQFLYVGHNMLERLHTDDEITLHLELKGDESGKLFELQRFFRWEHLGPDGEWVPWEDNRKLFASGLDPQPALADWEESERQLVSDSGRNFSRFWIRGALDFEKYYLELIREHPKGRFKPRRGRTRPMELRVEPVGTTTLQFAFSEPIRPGLRESLIIRFPRLSLTVNPTYVPGMEWFYLTEDGRWASLPERNLRIRGLDANIQGPLPADCATPVQVQATRTKAVDLAAITDEGELVVSLERQIQLQMFKGPNINRLEATSLESVPIEPFSNSEFNLKPVENQALYIGSDVFEDTVERVAFEWGYFFKNWKYPRAGATGLEDDLRRYSLKLEYRDKHKWRTIKLMDDEGTEYDEFCFADMQPNFDQEDQFFRVRMMLQPPKQMKGIAPVALNGVKTYWIRLILTEGDLTDQEEVNIGQTQTSKVDKEGEQGAAREASNIFINKDVHYFPQIFELKVQHRGARRKKAAGDGPQWYSHVLHDFEAIGVNYNRNNPRFTSIRPLVSRGSRKATSFPWVATVDINKPGRWVYMQFDRALQSDEEFSVYFRMTAEPVRGAERDAKWEYLDGDRWRELRFLPTPFDFRGSGFLRFIIPKLGTSSGDGVRWVRCLVPDRVRRADGTMGVARYPRLTHVMLNAAEVVNLQRRVLERFSAFGIPNQTVNLLFGPMVVLDHELRQALPEDLHNEEFISLAVNEGDDTRDWEWSEDDDLRDADRQSAMYAVDPARSTIRFGDGVHGVIPKSGTHNIVVQHYYTTDGLGGNVPAESISVCPTFGSQVVVNNPFPATGGRDVETVDDLVRRAPKALTGRSRAVTTDDFELIAKEASGTLARCHAYKDPMDDPWVVRLTVLPERDLRTKEIPDAEEIGLLRAVRDYVTERCLINTQVKVDMAELVSIAVELQCRLQPGTNPSGVRERAEEWVVRFLDPYEGGVDGEGWPFGELPRAEDLQHIITEIPEIRHVEHCEVTRAANPGSPLSVSRRLDPRTVKPRQLFVLAASPTVAVEEG